MKKAQKHIQPSLNLNELTTKFLSFSLVIVSLLILSCEGKKVGKENDIKNQCLCDSLHSLEEKGKNIIRCFVGKSQIEFKSVANNDTLEVTRFYTSGPVWLVQEYLLVSNNLIADNELALYCDIEDTSSFYKLTFVRNEKLKRNPDLFINFSLGVDAILNQDTIVSNNNFVLIPKERFTGIIKLDKKLNATYKGETAILRPSIYVEVDNIIKYGNLLEQYKAINRYCRVVGEKNTENNNR